MIKARKRGIERDKKKRSERGSGCAEWTYELGCIM